MRELILLAKRVGENGKGNKQKSKNSQNNEAHNLVGYQIRHDSSTIKPGQTAIKFMTDGILLRESYLGLALAAIQCDNFGRGT